MKFTYKKIYIILLLLILIQSKVFARDNKILYTKENISNYFLGIVSAKNYDNHETHKYLKKVQLLKNDHSRYNIEFLRALVLLGKFDKAFTFSENVWDKNELFFEADLLLGLNFFKNKDYKNSEKHFERLNKISRSNFYFNEFMSNVLIAWNKASEGKQKESFDIIEKISPPYLHLKKTQNVFLKCYFNMNDTQIFFEEIIQDKDYNFSRYNFFLANYFLFNNKEKDAIKIIKNIREKNSSNLLIKETETFLKEGKNEKIKNFFNCKNPNDSLAEFFYVLANLHSNEENYRLSNFYFKISEFLNEKFLTNKTLLAENFYYQKNISYLRIFMRSLNQ